MKRLHIRLFGRVQGVGFRFTCQREARALGLTGWVRNLPDDSVEIVAEGPPSALDALSLWCHHGPGFAEVDRADETSGPALGEFTSFEIRGY